MFVHVSMCAYKFGVAVIHILSFILFKSQYYDTTRILTKFFIEADSNFVIIKPLYLLYRGLLTLKQML
jgi:hypothetical protein